MYAVCISRWILVSGQLIPLKYTLWQGERYLWQGERKLICFLVLTRLFQKAGCAMFCLVGRKHYKQLCLVSLLQLPYCIHFSCCSTDHIHCMQLLFPDCICFSCCTPIASACDYAHSVQYEGHTSLVWTLHSRYRNQRTAVIKPFFCSPALHYKLRQTAAAWWFLA